MPLEAKWFDKGIEPTSKSNPAYPNGMTVDLAGDADCGCSIELPYPAKRCGLYVIKCSECNYTCGITTAGRPDDPRWVTVPCQLHRITKQ